MSSDGGAGPEVAQMSSASARVIKPSERSLDAGQTTGMLREAALSSKRMWAGVAFHAPHLFSDWHHHGKYESIIYVVRGLVRIECGTRGMTILEAAPGDFVFIPAGDIHREGNLTDETNEVVLMRYGRGPVLFNVDGPSDPEPASSDGYR
jgi:uncharacterized RmlC-like cupin family protein